MDLLQTFLEEASEHLSAMENALLEIEDSGVSQGHINTLFRAIHTIKGSAGMVGLDHVSYFAHHIESFLDALRSETVHFTIPMASFLMDTRDHLAELIHQGASPEAMAHSEQLIASVQQWHSPTSESNEASTSTETPPAADGYWQITIKPHSDTFTEGFDLLPVVKELTELGEHAVSVTFRPPEGAGFDPTKCYLQCLVLLDGDIAKEDIESAFMFVEDDWDVDIVRALQDEEQRLGDFLVTMGAANGSDIETVLSVTKRAGERLLDAGIVDKAVVDQALSQQQFVAKKQQSASSQASVKVPAEKLDTLLNLVGELVIVQSAVSQHAEESQDFVLTGIGEELSRLTTEIRDTTFGVRMLPIGSTFGRYRRLIRDLCQTLDKRVKLATEGAETEIDKMVLENLNDPLIHLLRNSMDHGIESPKIRRAHGKPEEGTIMLSASHKNGQVAITIRDDGAGLNTPRIREKAIANGVISESDPLSDDDINQLIFAPGFSTAKTVSDVSGRGVGMDVVKTSIEAMQGKIHLSSQPGKGTTIEILLPLTLAIIDGLMVSVGQEIFIVPLANIEECVEAIPVGRMTGDGACLVRSRGELVSATTLRHCFNVDGEESKYPQCIIVNVGETHFGLIVDDVIGQHQTVIKSLGKLYRDISGLMGSTILGNGDVAMIVDVNQLYEDCQPQLSILSHRETEYVDSN